MVEGENIDEVTILLPEEKIQVNYRNTPLISILIYP